jgi:pimeloyl-ACP methyl ester carboxylesterase
MELTAKILPPYERCTDGALPMGFFDPPSRFVDPQHEFRLIPQLREAAQTRNPYKILARAAAVFFEAQHLPTGSSPELSKGLVELGNALADLAVTGRMAYALFKTPPLNALDELAVASGVNYIDLQHPPLSEAELQETIGGLLASLVQANPAEAASAISPALDRAYAVAWALRGPAAQRVVARAPLRWIAVSGEDDMPHRPINVPSPPFEQYEIPVTARGVTVQTRFFIASPPGGALPAVNPPSTRVLPPDPQPCVPDGNNVILFLHGHSSGAEEALTIIPHIHMAGLKLGKKFSIISFDLPNNGYSESFNHEKVATSSATTWPAGLLDHGPVATPVLDFIEDFIVAFVDTLDQITPIKNRFSGVIGGSLGGNMGLRLGRRNPMPAWLSTSIVSWNAASVWDPMIQDLLKSQAPGKCQNSWNATETPDSRVGYFHEVYEKTVLPIIVPHTQPELWYRSGWEPCKTLHIKGSRIARREIYNANFRQWHWRVAGEQLVYSHVDRVDHSDSNTPFRYTLNTVNQLLVASENDNFAGSNIFDATRTLASLMVNTPGRSLLLRNTGHSVHFERPAFFAKQIVGFLPSTPPTLEMPAMPMSMQITCIYREEVLSVGKKKRTGPPKLGRILLVGGINQTQNIPFSITVAECVFYIDHGCEFFVIRADGSRTAVQVVRKGGSRPYISTVHDNSEANNLLSLPKC